MYALIMPQNKILNSQYSLSEHHSAEKTAQEMEHGDTKMLFEHYRELVTKEAAKRYRNIHKKKFFTFQSYAFQRTCVTDSKGLPFTSGRYILTKQF